MLFKPKILFASATDVGKKRSHNEDACAYHETEQWAVLADGMGGHEAGEVASEIIIHTFENHWKDHKALPPKERLKKLIQLANGEIFKKGKAANIARGMGSTLVALVFEGSYFTLAWVGDSRAYLLRKNKLYQLTKDHSLVQLQVDMRILTEEEARNSRMRHILIRSVGGKEEVEVSLYGPEKFKKEDLFLLCSDGFYQSFTLEEIKQHLQSSQDLPELANQLVQEANDRDGSDNITVLLAKIL